MIGVIDIGNTRYHCGVGKDIKIVERIDTTNIKDVKYFFSKVHKILVISVSEKKLNDVVKALKNKEVVRFPLEKIKREYSGIVGEDRIASALYVRVVKKFPAIVVDAGSAITIDFIDGHGIFSGGAILPGISSFLSSFKGQEKLKAFFSIDAIPFEKIGKNTAQNIRHGLFIYIKGIIDYVNSKDVKYVFLTGGDADLFLGQGWIYDPDIVLKGGLVAYNLFA